MINNVVLQGKLGQDFDLRYTQSGEAVAKTSIAVKRNYKSQNESQPSADWINITFWGKRAESVANYFRKGDEILITGRIQTGSYVDQQDTKKYTFEVRCDSFNFPGGKSSENRSNSNSYPQNNTHGDNSNNRSSYEGEQSFERDADPFAGAGQNYDVDDSQLPF